MNFLIYICAIVGGIFISFLLWIFLISPFIKYLKRLYIFYVLKKIRIARYSDYGSLFGIPYNYDTEIITHNQFKEKYGRFDIEYGLGVDH